MMSRPFDVGTPVLFHTSRGTLPAVAVGVVADTILTRTSTWRTVDVHGADGRILTRVDVRVRELSRSHHLVTRA